MRGGTYGDPRVNAKHKRPDCGLTGWASAWTLLERIDDAEQRDTLSDLTRSGGVQGAPALRYLAGMLRWYAGLADYPTPSAAMDGPTAAYVERRARELLAAHDGTGLFPSMRKLTEPQTEAA